MVNPILKVSIRFYQKWIAPMMAPACRFHPSCSEYSWQALDRYPLIRAGGLILWRLLRCHPFHAGGHDPLK